MAVNSEIRAREILSRLGKDPKGVEVGVFRGALARRLLLRKDLHLTLVDSWGEYRDTYKPSGDWFATLGQKNHDDNMKAALQNTSRFEERRKVIRCDSVEASEQIEDASLDFVFIDADHSYEGCKKDIEAWRPKLKPGALLCGHDYAHPHFPNWGVKQAVDEWANENGYKVELGQDYTWFIRLRGPLPVPSEHYNQIVVCCVKWGDKYGAEYVNVLADMVARNLDYPYEFVCFTDDPTGIDENVTCKPLPEHFDGWWNKLSLFRNNLFKKGTRVLFLDLDTAIVGPIEDLIDHKGIILDWHVVGYNSSVMCWDAGEHTVIWEKINEDAMKSLHGDQDWITEIDPTWPKLPYDWVVSYRAHAVDWPPSTAKIVCFHGSPKCHEVTEGWVPEIWSMGGLAIPRYVSQINNSAENILLNVKTNVANEIPSIVEVKPHKETICIVGGGPSLSKNLMNLQLEKAAGNKVWALNGSHDFLIERGIVPDGMVMLDSRPENLCFLETPNEAVTYYIATQCDPKAYEYLHGLDVKKWTAWTWGIDGLDKIVIGGGPTVGLKAMCLAYVQGYRKFRLYGFDSSYGESHHAYPQSLNDKEETTEVVLRGKKYLAAKWMVRQTREFQEQARLLMADGCEIELYCTGLLPDACNEAMRQAEIPQFRSVK